MVVSPSAAMRGVILLALLPVALSSPFCMCPNNNNGQQQQGGSSCPPPPPQPQCPQQKPCERDSGLASNSIEMPTFPALPTLPPMNRGLLGGFTLPTLPPSMNFFPNLFVSTTTEDPYTLAPTAPPPPPPPPPTLAPYNQPAPIGVQPSGQQQQLPFSQSGVASQQANQQMMMAQQQQNQQRMMMNGGGQQGGMQQMGQGQMMPQQPMPQQQQQFFQHGARQFAGISATTDDPRGTMMMERGGQLLTGTVAESNDMEIVHPNKNSFALYENEENRGFRQPVKRAAAEEVSIEKCNDDRLKKIILDNVDANPSTSKRAIQKAASEQIGGLFDVICSTHDFSYLANTQLFCEAGNDDVTCFAFLHTLLQ